ncbi:MAG: hypothetical protein MUE79_08175, partial [Nitratireductor sp.]|nr:hypothetical protein [Nitratireductor sp.]
PANAVYTVDVASFGGTTGDFRLKLTREGQADLMSFRFPRLNVLNSGSLRDDQVFVTDYRAGDQVTADGGERRVQTLLTFELPAEQSSGVAALDLRDCSEGGTGFSGLGLLAIYVEDYGALQSARDLTQPGTGARLLTELSACGTVDVTEAVAAAYAAGRSNIQFRLAFPAANGNEQTDEVRFDPRLLISVAE